MNAKIGKAAGTIWNYLNKNGTQSLTALATGTKLEKNILHWGIGWLAREEKISITKVKGKYEFTLTD